MNALSKLSIRRLQELMDLSEDLAKLNLARYKEWSSDFESGTLKQALLAFKGDVYQSMDADSMSSADLEFAQRHLRILSGLHGLLRPMDFIKPYRLEMGTALSVKGKKNLYDFWGETPTQRINAQLADIGSNTVVNLASAEYYKVVKANKLHATVITPSFKDHKNGQLKALFLYVKQARGAMSGFAIRHRITDAEALKEFSGMGYHYTEALSDATNWVFTR